MFSRGHMLRVMYTAVLTSVVSSFVELNNDIVIAEIVDVVNYITSKTRTIPEAGSAIVFRCNE
jgi:hypothetical protein